MPSLAALLAILMMSLLLALFGWFDTKPNPDKMKTVALDGFGEIAIPAAMQRVDWGIAGARYGPPGHEVAIKGFWGRFPNDEKAKPKAVEFAFSYGAKHDFGGNRNVPALLLVRVFPQSAAADPLAHATAAAVASGDARWYAGALWDNPPTLIDGEWSEAEGVYRATANYGGSPIFGEVQAVVGRRSRLALVWLGKFDLKGQGEMDIVRRGLVSATLNEAELDRYFALLDEADAAYAGYARSTLGRAREALAKASNTPVDAPLPYVSQRWAIHTSGPKEAPAQLEYIYHLGRVVSPPLDGDQSYAQWQALNDKHNPSARYRLVAAAQSKTGHWHLFMATAPDSELHFASNLSATLAKAPWPFNEPGVHAYLYQAIDLSQVESVNVAEFIATHSALQQELLALALIQSLP